MKLTIEEKARLLSGVGSWHTYDANGKLPSIMMSDGPHGLRKQEMEEYADINKSAIATCFPTASAVSSSWNMNMVELMAEAIASEALKEKISIVLGCGTNIKRSPLCGRNFEYFSEDPYLSGKCAASYIKAMESKGIGTSLKHFAMNNQESQRQTSNSSVDKRAMHEIYLKPFEMAIKEGKPATIMGSYNRINGEYACANKWLLNDILRKKWGYEGLVISDWGATMDVVKCINAGLDIEMPDSYGYHTKQIIEAVNSGEISQRRLDESVERIETLVNKYKPKEKTNIVDYDEQNEIACHIETESAVLLKHSGDFPISKNEKILILGNMAKEMRFQGGGSSHITTIKTKSAYDCLFENGYNVEFSEEIPDDLERFDKIIYFCGLTDKLESEGYDRVDLNMPEEMVNTINKLVKKASNVSLVTFGGSAFIIPQLDKLKDVLHMHLGGQAVGQACYRLLSGIVNPSGKLTETYPLKIEDTPCFGNWGGKTNNAIYAESIFVGYRYYETFDIPVQFEFGYGLSYTSFEYENLSVSYVSENEKILHIEYDIVNTGNVAGAEVSQVYIINTSGQIMRPKIELRSFSKQYLKPGQRVKVKHDLKESDFCIFDVVSDDFVMIYDEYEIAVGSSCRDIRLSKKIDLSEQKGRNNNYSGKYTIRKEEAEYWQSIKSSQGHFSREEFEKYYGDKIKDFDTKEIDEDYTVLDSLQDVCKASFIGRVILKVATIAIGIVIKAPQDDPAYLMIYNGMREAPLDSLISVSNGIIKPGFIRFLVKRANKTKNRTVAR